MAYDRYGQNDPQRDYSDRAGRGDDGEGDGRRGGYGARDYQSAGELGGYGRDNQRDYSQRDQGSRDQGQRDYGRQDYGQRSYGDYAARDYGAGRQTERQGRGGAGGGWGDQDRYRQGFTGGSDYYRGDQDRGNFGRDSYRQSRGTFDRQPQNYGQGEDRGFMERAGDEVRSWFGDEEAERRREQDARRSEREGGYGRDEHYQSWRDQQVAAFDRDYHEYRQENQAKFHNEFSSWRTERQGQRDLLGQVKEHLEVVGSDGEHVGTVDKVRDDRVILTKSDQDAGGRHHSFPSRWIKSVDDKVTLTKSAAEAKQQWQDEERQNAMFGDAKRDAQNRQAGTGGVQSDDGTNLNRSFSGTY